MMRMLSAGALALGLFVTACGGDKKEEEAVSRDDLAVLDSIAALEGPIVSVFDSAPAIRPDLEVQEPQDEIVEDDPDGAAAAAPPRRELPNPTERVREAETPRGRAAAPAPPQPGIGAAAVARPAPPAPAPAPAGAGTSAVPRAAAPAPTVAAAADPATANARGLAHFSRRSYAAAVSQFASAVAAVPSNAAFRNNYGWALFKAGNIPEAERELLEVLRLNPRRGIAYANLGEVRLARGDIVGGAAAYQRFLDLNQDPVRQRIAQEKLRQIRSRQQ